MDFLHQFKRAAVIFCVVTSHLPQASAQEEPLSMGCDAYDLGGSINFSDGTRMVFSAEQDLSDTRVTMMAINADGTISYPFNVITFFDNGNSVTDFAVSSQDPNGGGQVMDPMSIRDDTIVAKSFLKACEGLEQLSFVDQSSTVRDGAQPLTTTPSNVRRSGFHL